MVIAFLDDDPNRTKNFKSYVPSAHTESTAEGIINYIKSQEKIDELFLDHDLGGEIYVDSSLPNTGMEVVRWIVANKPNIDWIVVHSHNPPAAHLMYLKLKDAGYEVQQTPFITVLEALKLIAEKENE